MARSFFYRSWRSFVSATILLSTSAQPVIATPSQKLHVMQKCGRQPRCFDRIALALEAADKDRSDRQIDIHVAAGNYREKVTIRRPQTRIIGAGAARTRLHYDSVAQNARNYHRDGWGTPGSATLTINADQIEVSGITVENDFDYLSNDARDADDPNKIANAQAVALLLDVASDHVLLDHVALVGYQDTLFANGNRALIRHSLVSGNIDFIFGNGMLWIENSELRSRRRAATFAPGELQSYIAAPSTPKTQSIGIVIVDSRLTREPGVPDGSVALARPWHPTTTFPDGRYADPDAIGHTLFADCFMDRHISAQHWTSMAGTARDGSKTAIFQPQDARFFEVGSYGPGAKRRDVGMTWTPSADVRTLREAFFRDWQLVP